MKYLIILFITLFPSYSIAQWSDVGGGTNNRIYSLFSDTTSDLLFVGGQFNMAGSISANSIATWNGSQWSAFGSNDTLSNPHLISAINRYGNSIIIAGEFDSIGQNKVNNIASWNGNNWQNLTSGLNGSVYTLVSYNNNLYAGGIFNSSGSTQLACLAKWDGLQWSIGADITGIVYSLCVFNGKLVAGGNFYSNSNSNVHNIIAIDSSGNIDTSFKRFNNSIFALKNIDDTLIAVGEFTSNSDTVSPYISTFYNSSWHYFKAPTGGSNEVYDACKYNGDKYFCGNFSIPSELCRYRNFGYDSIANANGYFKKLEVYKGQMYAAGFFYNLNNLNIDQIGRYDLTNNILENEYSLNIIAYPNPLISNRVYIDYDFFETIQLKIYSVFGQEMTNITIHDKNYIIIDLKPGLYYFNFNAGERNKSIKIIKL